MPPSRFPKSLGSKCSVSSGDDLQSIRNRLCDPTTYRNCSSGSAGTFVVLLLQTPQEGSFIPEQIRTISTTAHVSISEMSMNLC